MRPTFLALLSILTLIAAAPAHAEKRMFIIASDTGGYGVDRCLASGAACGAAAAAAYCRSRDYSRVVSFRKVDREDITGAVPTRAGTCRGSGCDEFVAIECSR